ncbi:hypothetical protein MXB_3411 [Myxobolus squamalis]|nr:hypothetical protein MXB_3411 [Myxobolus squamalis]
MKKSKENNSTQRAQIPSTIWYLIIEKVVSDGESISKVAEELRLKKSTVDSIVKTFQMIGIIEMSTVCGHRSTKITSESEQLIETLIEFNSSITLDNIKRSMFTLNQCDVSITKISSYL